MVIASNDWVNYDDVKKQSQLIETTNALMMAAPSALAPPSAVSATIGVVGAPNNNNVINLTTQIVGNNGTTTTTTILNDSSSMNDGDEPGCESNIARMVLVCQPDSHPFQTRTIYLTPNIECKVGRSIAKSKSSDNNAIFDCKVLSRTHAVLWYSSDGKFYVKDTKSSNGTYINDRKINSSEPVELNFGDVVKFGVEVIENSRKEVHGCIIASVKPYLPDGREAISITQESPFRGDSRISFEELHRLNLYMQETSQREKVLKAKLHNIQNILDATRKNSSICWQSMIDEDRLLNRIDLLEKKLLFLQKNSPADQLKEEILKLQEEKFVYQNSAKEALSKVYQERMEALQKLSKVERDFTCSENECSLLREQIRYTKQNLQDVNTLLLSLEKEYNEYKEQMEKCQRETSEEQSHFEAAVAELATKLKDSETECEDYKKKIGELLLQLSDELDAEDKKKMEKYTEEESVVDAVLAAVKTEDNNVIDSNKPHESDDNNENETTDQTQQQQLNHTEDETSAAAATNNNSNKSTIMKWLENSDLNSKEGSLDIMKAICNDTDSSDDSENNDEVEKSSICTSNTITTTASNSSATATPTPTPIPALMMLQTSGEHIANKLQMVDRNLIQLEAELGSKQNATGVENGIDQLENVSYQLLNYTVALLRETYSELRKHEVVKKPQLHMQETLVNDNDDADDDGEEDDDDDEEEDDVAEAENENKDKQYKRDLARQKQDLADYQNEILQLKQQLESQQSKSSDSLKSLQFEWDNSKEQISHFNELIENLREKNETLQSEIAEYKNKSSKLISESLEESNRKDDEPASLDKLIEEDKALNNAAILNEEELILYKERFGRTQAENLKLKREIAELKLKFDDLAKAIFRKSLTYVTVFVALIVYFIFSYM